MPKAQGKIEHVVVRMLENRSFDHVLGLSKGLHGLLDAKDVARRRDVARSAPATGAAAKPTNPVKSAPKHRETAN